MLQRADFSRRGHAEKAGDARHFRILYADTIYTPRRGHQFAQSHQRFIGA